jgi:hypothetical protein
LPPQQKHHFEFPSTALTSTLVSANTREMAVPKKIVRVTLTLQILNEIGSHLGAAKYAFQDKRASGAKALAVTKCSKWAR